MRRATTDRGHDWTRTEPGDDGGSGDARLVAGLRRRTPAAFAGLHEQYAPRIYSLALRMVRHAPDAEDITQDVLIRAYERLPREREVLLRPWLYRVTVNRCYDHLRAAARRRPTESGAGYGARRGGADGRHLAELEPASPHDLFEQSELNRLFETTLQDLTRRQRAALLLKDVHGLSLVEVAACLEVTPGSIEVLLARARNAFRAGFESRCREEGRPVPDSAKVLAALPALPLPVLPSSLVPLPVPPAPAAFSPLSLAVPPVAAAAGSGIGAVLSLPAQVKTAALIIAAATTMGGAEVVTTHVDRDQRSTQAVGGALVAQSEPREIVANAGRNASPPLPVDVSAGAVMATPPPEPSVVVTPASDVASALEEADPDAQPVETLGADPDAPLASTPTSDASATPQPESEPSDTHAAAMPTPMPTPTTPTPTGTPTPTPTTPTPPTPTPASEPPAPTPSAGATPVL